MFTERDLGKILSKVNWTFPESPTPDRSQFGVFDARKTHWYPATFIPEIPYTLVQALSQPGDSVLDPFAGVGTTLWQSELLGRHGYGVELNAVAAKVMEAIWGAMMDPSPLRLLASVRDAISGAVGMARQSPPDVLRPWFSKGTWEELSCVRFAYDSLDNDPAAQGLLFLATSSLLRVLSEQRRGWGCIADNMVPRYSDLGDAPMSRDAVRKVMLRAGVISRQIAAFSKELNSRGWQGGDRASQRILHGDIRRVGSSFARGTFQLVVTSPPYPGMMDYATAQRLSYYWLGLDPEVDLVYELGARRRRQRKDSLARYTADTVAALQETAALVKSDGFMCLILPVFASGSEDPRQAALDGVIDGLRGEELKIVWTGNRNLPSGRRQLNQGWATLQRERIIVYRVRGRR